MPAFLKKNLFNILIIILAVSLYLYQVSGLKGWNVDDAGISFAYARNLAQGSGLVSQPNVRPVEGFSNPAWVFLLALFSRMGMDVVSISQPLSVGLIILAIVFLYLSSLQLTASKLIAMLVVIGVILQPAFVIWSVSGLENPLLVFLVVLLFYLCLAAPKSALAILAGFISGLISLTRPDGLIFIPVYACLHPRYFKPALIPSIFIWGSYLIFRIFYFGAFFPNPYYIKAEGKIMTWTWLLSIWSRFKSLLIGAFGNRYLALLAVMVLFLLLGWLLWKRRLNLNYLILGIFLALTLGAYLLLPSDWMGEYRFASSLFPFLYLLIALFLTETVRLFKMGKTGQIVISVVLLAGFFGVLYLTSFAPRLTAFAKNPTVPLQNVRADFFRFKQYASSLGLKKISVLLPDVGGGLYYYPEIRIYDLGGLTDASIARTLGKDQNALYNYLFDQVKPDFIHMHGTWTYQARLDADPRFRQEYVAVTESIDRDILARYGEQMYSGDYVRRDLLHTPDELTTLKSIQH